MIEAIGAELVESIEEASTATHVIASDGKTKLRRTPKLMICISKVSKILSIDWLERSSAELKVLDTDDFLLLDDKEAEETYNFSMKETLDNGLVARCERGGVLGGWSVYICSGVAGNKAPTRKELHLILEAAGAHVLESLSETHCTDPAKTIVLTSDPCTEAQLREDGIQRVTSLGARKFSTSWLFRTIITQRFTNANSEESVMAKLGVEAVTPQRKVKRKASLSPLPGSKRRKSTHKKR